jgi:hypothetical protein
MKPSALRQLWRLFPLLLLRSKSVLSPKSMLHLHPTRPPPVAVNTEENVGGDTSDMAHVVELEAARLAASSFGREGPIEPAAAAPAEAPVIVAEAEV